jgi:hypothetical protein
MFDWHAVDLHGLPDAHEEHDEEKRENQRHGGHQANDNEEVVAPFDLQRGGIDWRHTDYSCHDAEGKTSTIRDENAARRRTAKVRK